MRWSLGCFLFGGGVVLSTSQWVSVKTRGHADPTVSTVALLLILTGIYHIAKASNWFWKK